MMHNNFNRDLVLSKRCRVSHNLQVFTPLYRGVKETLRVSSTSKSRCWSLIKSSMICCLIWLMS